jgi:hypothetical protein
MRRVHLLSALVAIVISAAACSGGSDTSSPAAAAPSAAQPADPCTLVTSAELQDLLGDVPSPVGPTERLRGRSCDWRVPGGASVSLTVWPGREFFLDDPATVAVTGLGDAAHVVDNVVGAVTWRQGDVTAQLTGVVVGGRAQDRLVGVARQVAARLS